MGPDEHDAGPLERHVRVSLHPLQAGVVDLGHDLGEVRGGLIEAGRGRRGRERGGGGGGGEGGRAVPVEPVPVPLGGPHGRSRGDWSGSHVVRGVIHDHADGVLRDEEGAQGGKCGSAGRVDEPAEELWCQRVSRAFLQLQSDLVHQTLWQRRVVLGGGVTILGAVCHRADVICPFCRLRVVPSYTLALEEARDERLSKAPSVDRGGRAGGDGLRAVAKLESALG